MIPYSLNSFLEVNNNRITGLENPIDDQDGVNKRYLVNNYIANSEIGVSVAPLVGGIVPSANLPAYVDEVLEFNDLVSFPMVGIVNKIYLDLSANLIYRWSGSTYVQISQGNSIPSLISYFTNDSNYITLSNVTWANIPDKPPLDFIPLTEKGVPLGVAPLDNNALIPSIYLPSFVDDILEYANVAALPITGESGKIYVTLDTNKTYRWSSTVYVEISESAIVPTVVSAFINDSAYITAADLSTASSDFVKRDGTTPLTANWNVGGFNVTNIAALDVTGATTLGGTLGVTGITTTNRIINTGNINNFGNMTNSGTLTTATAAITGTLDVGALAQFNNNIAMTPGSQITVTHIIAGGRMSMPYWSGTNFFNSINYGVRTLAALNLISPTEGENALVTERGIRNAIDGVQFTSAQVENGLSTVAGKIRLGGTLLTGNTDLVNVTGSTIRIRDIANTADVYTFGQTTFAVGTSQTTMAGSLLVAGTTQSTGNFQVNFPARMTVAAATGNTVIGAGAGFGNLTVNGTSTFVSAQTFTGVSTHNNSVIISGVNTLTVGTGAVTFGGKPTAALTLPADVQATLTTKSYVDSLATPVLLNTQIFVGSASNLTTAVNLSGDLSITNLGVASVTTAAVTNNKLAQMAANTVKVNNTATSAVAIDLALTSNTLLGRASGNILAVPFNSFVERISGSTGNRSTAIISPLIGQLYSNTTTGRLEWYDGAVWRSLPYAQILLTEIQNIAPNRFLGNLTGVSTTPQEIVGLDILDSAQQSYRYNIGGINEWLSGSLFNQVTSVTVGNTVTETNLIGTGQTGSTATLPTSFFVAGKSLNAKMRGFIATNATAPTIRICVKLGAIILLDSGVVAMNAITGTQLFELDFDLTCRTTGVSGTVIEQGIFRYFRDNISEERIALVSTSTTTINTTITQLLTITITWGTANAANTITSTNFKLIKEG